MNVIKFMLEEPFYLTTLLIQMGPLTLVHFCGSSMVSHPIPKMNEVGLFD